jgi:hypothetical protein
MAHLLPVVGNIIGRNKDELRRDVSICEERVRIRELKLLHWGKWLTVAETKARHVPKTAYYTGTYKWLFICHTYETTRPNILRNKCDFPAGNIGIPCQLDSSQGVPLLTPLADPTWTETGRLS